VLRGAGGVLAGSLVVGTAAADHPDAQPTYVDITYEPDVLDTYAPVFDIAPEDREKLDGLYGWVARAPADERDTFVCCYFMKYTLQEGWLGPTTSHRGDHEPVQVEVNRETGDVTCVRASVYHWLKGESDAAGVPFADNDTSPRLRVFTPHHHYGAAAPTAATERFDVEDLTEIYDAMLANGMEGDLYPGAFRNPWVMRNRGHFWRDTAAGLSIDAAIASALAAVGYGGRGSLEA
jgi:hypothetical protein